LTIDLKTIDHLLLYKKRSIGSLEKHFALVRTIEVGKKSPNLLFSTIQSIQISD